MYLCIYVFKLKSQFLLRQKDLKIITINNYRYKFKSTYMKMQKITFVCCPKPFLPEFAYIQNNAIMSWTKLETVEKIIICGNEEGVEEYANELMTKINRRSVEILYIKNIVVNEYGTPLVNHLFKIGAENCNKYVCYINSDIVLLSDFDNTLKSFLHDNPTQNDFLMVGRRWDWYNPEAIEFDENWQTKYKEKALKDGRMHEDTGIDYFLHTSTTFPNMWPFAIGKFWWDNWVVGNAYKRQNVMTIDATNTIFAIHQNSPWFSKNTVVRDAKDVQSGTEALRNRAFDSFGCTITQGTKHVSKKNNDSHIVFVRK